MTTAFLNEYTITVASGAQAVTAGAANFLVVAIGSTGDVTAVTWDGVAMTQGVELNFTNQAEVWYLLNPAKSGTYTLAITATGFNQAFMMFFSGVWSLAGSPVYDTSSTGNTDLSVSVSVDVEKVGDLVCYAAFKASSGGTWANVEDGAGYAGGLSGGAYEDDVPAAGAGAEGAAFESGGSFATAIVGISFKQQPAIANQSFWFS